MKFSKFIGYFEFHDGNYSYICCIDQALNCLLQILPYQRDLWKNMDNLIKLGEY